MSAANRVIDGDGHVIEDDAVAEYLTEPYRSARRLGGLYPPLDHLHNEPVQMLEGSVNLGTGPAEWSAFLDSTGIAATVMYPTRGLAIGNVTSPDWAIALCAAYNTWLHETYLRRDARFNGMALLPVQDMAAAVDELRRAVTELGMCGAVVPSNGMGLKGTLGGDHYWPLYAEAERLGCSISVHGGVAARLGLDGMETRPGSHALGHPFGLLVACAGMVLNGVFDKFPGLRVAFLEGGVAWMLLALERFDRSFETHIPFDPRGRLIQLAEGQRVSDYVLALMRQGRLFVGCEGEEPEIGYAVKRMDANPFLFSSDFPHEVNAATCAREIKEIEELEALTDADRTAILRVNAQRFYAFGDDSPEDESLPRSSPVTSSHRAGAMMPKITFVRPEDTMFLTTEEIRRRRMERAGSNDDGMESEAGPSAETRFHLVGSDTEPQLFEPRFAPNTTVEAHAHDEDEVIYVLEGELIFGSRSFGPGCTISIPGRTLYGFRTGAEGARFLNFRPRADTTFITKEEFGRARAEGQSHPHD